MKKKTPKAGIIKEVKKQEPLVIEGNLSYKLSINENGYELETSNTAQNDVAAMLHARSVVEMIKKDSELTKASDFYKMMTPEYKKRFNDRYNKLIHASYILGTLSGELLQKAMILETQKDEKQDETRNINGC